MAGARQESFLTMRVELTMKGVLLFFTLTSLSLLLTERARADNHGPVVTWGHANTVLRQGENLELVCTVSNMDSFSVVRVVHSQGGVNRTVADNYNLKPPYNRLARYHVQYSVSDTTRVATLVLRYTGIEGEDSGLLACYRLTNDHQRYEATISIKVLVPVSELYVIQLSDAPGPPQRVTEGGTVTFEQGRHLGVGCVVVADKALIPPEVQVTVDREDETEAFTTIHDVTPLRIDSGLSANRSVVTVSLRSDRPRVQWNEKLFKCVVLQRAYAHIAVTATLVVRYVPIVTCTHYTVEVGRHGNTTFNCTVLANPSSRLTWAHQSQRDIERSPDFVITDKATDACTTAVSLTIKRLSDAFLGNYTLTAANDLGQVTVTLGVARRVVTPPARLAPPTSQNMSSAKVAPSQQQPTNIRLGTCGLLSSPSSLPALLALLAFLLASPRLL